LRDHHVRRTNLFLGPLSEPMADGILTLGTTFVLIGVAIQYRQRSVGAV
jgi:hypothetical protein